MSEFGEILLSARGCGLLAPNKYIGTGRSKAGDEQSLVGIAPSYVTWFDGRCYLTEGQGV